MKKFLIMLLALTMFLSLVACGAKDDIEDEGAEGPAVEEEAPAEETPAEEEEPEEEVEVEVEVPADDGSFELALITDVGTIDDKSFNQGSWEGLAEYAEEHDISHKYYKPTEQSDSAYMNSIDLAVENGAQVIVCPGFLFEVAVFEKQSEYPDVKFVLIDGAPHNEDYSEFRTDENVLGILYREDEVGFLAGYAAVHEGYRDLGFMGGMAVPAVIRFGYGYVQGAEYAAKELDLTAGDVSINYHYTGDFVPSPENKTRAASWYNDGLEVIFAAAGGAGSSVMAAAEDAEKSGAVAKVFGVDVDQSFESDTVISSAVKNLQKSVYEAIAAHYDGTWTGADVVTLGAAEDMILLPMETSKFENFTQDQYDAIYAKLVAGEIELMNDEDAETVEGLEPVLELVTVTEIN